MTSSEKHVYIARPGSREEWRDVIREGFAHTHLDARIASASSIFIKPNLVTDNPDYIERGANTDMGVIEELFAYLRDASKAAIMIGESETGTPVKGRRFGRVVGHMGLAELCQRYDVELVNMTEDRKVMVPIPRGRFLRGIELSEKFMSSELVINMPKLKTHKYATITCALKNMFGAIPDPLRISYHKNIHQTLADLHSVLGHKTIVLCDGLVAMEGGGPLWGIRKEMGLLIFASDPLACDRVAHQIMSFPRQRVRHIGLTEDLMGPDAGSEPQVHGLAIADVAERFEPAHKNWWIRLEEELMRHRSVVKVVFHPSVQKRVIYPMRSIFARLRGGSYTWYVDQDGKG